MFGKFKKVYSECIKMILLYIKTFEIILEIDDNFEQCSKTPREFAKRKKLTQRIVQYVVIHPVRSMFI